MKKIIGISLVFLIALFTFLNSAEFNDVNSDISLTSLIKLNTANAEPGPSDCAWRCTPSTMYDCKLEDYGVVYICYSKRAPYF